MMDQADQHTIFSIFFEYWQIGLLFLASFFLLVLFKRLLEKKPKGYQYRRKSSIMTQAEQNLFTILVEIVGGKYYVFPQIHLDAILDHKILGQNWFGAFRHINEKSVDFVICDKQYETPLLAIELDDRSHEREDRVLRDSIVNDIFKNSAFPLVRLSSKEAIEKEFVKQRVLGVLNLENDKNINQTV